MDLIKEAKKSNKDAYLALVDKYNVIFYKIARVYFTLDIEIYNSLEKALSNAFHGIVNCKNEKAYLLMAIKELVTVCEKSKNKTQEKDISEEDVAESLQKNAKYRMYASDSAVEKCMLSLEKEYRLPSLLYFYADLTPKEIAKITNLSKAEINKIIASTRIKIYDKLKEMEV